MADEKKYPKNNVSLPVLQKPGAIMQTFTSRKEADLYRIKKNLKEQSGNR